MTMLFDTLSTAHDLEATGIERSQAEAIAAAIGRTDERLATKADLAAVAAEMKADIAELRAETKADIAELKAETKADIAELRAETKADNTELRAEIAELRAETKADIAELRTEMKAANTVSRAEMKAGFAALEHRMTNRLGTMMIAAVGIIVAAIKLL